MPTVTLAPGQMIVLASNSPRRKQLLALAGWPFLVKPVDVDESPQEGEAPRTYTLRLAEEKAFVADQNASPNTIIITSDTTVADQKDVLGKPVDENHAVTMLTRLRGRSHLVYTAVAVLYQGEIFTDIGETEVTMRNYSDDALQAYVASGDPMDKAGAYAIQHTGFHPVANLVGCYANVMGLPVCHLARLLTRLGIAHDPILPQACQQALQHECHVFSGILCSP